MAAHDEAIKKWCPLVRIGNGDVNKNRDCSGGVIANGPGIGIAWNCCIAHACMMWRADPRAKMHGYCGIAGIE